MKKFKIYTIEGVYIISCKDFKEARLFVDGMEKSNNCQLGYTLKIDEIQYHKDGTLSVISFDMTK